MTARISLNLGRTGVIDRPAVRAFSSVGQSFSAEVLSENPGIFLIVEALALVLRLYEENFRVVIPIHSGGIHRWHFESTQARICKGFKVWLDVCLFFSKKGR